MKLDRLQRVRTLLKQRNCSHILISDVIDIRYLCGFCSSRAFLLVSQKKSCLFTDFRYRKAARDFCRKHRKWTFISMEENDYSSLVFLVPGGSRLGVQSNSMSVDELDRIRRAVRRVKIVKLSDAVSIISMSKSNLEAATMHACARIGDKALAKTIEELKLGMTEEQVAAILERYCRDLGSQKPAFDTIVLFGARCALPHGTPSNARLKIGDWVLFDFGCTLGGLCSDMTRTVVMGKASEGQKKIYGIVYKAQQRARRGVRSGVSAASVDSLARSVIEKAGYGKYFGHGTGHGLGYRIHEPPRLNKTNTLRLVERCVVTVEPGIYIPRFGGVRIEDMVYLNGRNPGVMTHFPRHLIELGV